MILFILIAIVILIYTIFAEDGLINSIKEMNEYNERIKSYHRCNYSKKDLKSIRSVITEFIFYNIALNVFNVFIVLIISFFVICVYPKTAESEYSFGINSLQDNIVTEGKIYGRAFYTRGYIDGELSYFFSRTMSKGEVIGHIPANDTYIKYDNENNPCIEVHQISYDFPEWLTYMLPVEMLNNKEIDYYVIVVPEGTMTSDGIYKIDME